MARARNIKPAFFKNEALVELPVETRLLFIGLWTLADREGRLEDRPKRIKMEIYPSDSFDVESMLAELQLSGFINRYNVDGCSYIEVVNFVKHQDPHYRERASEIPPPPGKTNSIIATNVTRTQRQRILDRGGNVCAHCGSQDQLCIDHIIPVSKGGGSGDENLQVLCLSCNTKKGNRLTQDRVDVDSTHARLVPLIPDSLIPELSTSNEVDVGIFDPDTQQDETEDSTRAKDEAQPAGGQAPADRNPCPLKRIVELYHELLPELPRVEKLTKARVGYVQQRWREDLPSVDSWRAYFADVRNSKFLMGKSQGRDGKPPFRADLEWLTRPGNFAKVAEGKYHS